MNNESYIARIFLVAISLAAPLLVGCGRSDLASRADVQEIDKRLDVLLGDLDAFRQRLAELTDKATTVPASQIDKLIEQQTQFQNQLPVLAGIELSQELGDLDWLLSIRRSLSSNPDAITLSDAEALLDEVPLSLEWIAPRLAAEHASQTAQVAESLLGDELVDADDVLLVQGILDRMQTPDGDATKLSETRKRIAVKLKSLNDQKRSNQLKADAVAIESQLSNVSNIADADLRRTALIGLNQMAESVRVRWIAQGMDESEAELSGLHLRIEKQLAESLEKLADDQSRSTEKARMKYQAWALGEIQTLKEMFASEGWFENNYQKKHDAAVKHLLPINQTMLEPPVAKFYNEAFETIWQQIEDGAGMQLSLARKTAEVPKRSLESFVEKTK